MSSHPCPGLFETTHSALLLPEPANAAPNSPNASLDKNFWVLRELGRTLVLIDPGAELLALSRVPEGIPI